MCILTSASPILRAMPRFHRGNRREGENNRQVSKVVGQNYATNIGRCLIDLETLQIASSSHLSFRVECTRRDVGGKTRRDRSVSAVDPIDRDSCAKKTFGFLRRETWFFCALFEKKDGKTHRSSIAGSRENLSLSLCLAVWQRLFIE